MKEPLNNGDLIFLDYLGDNKYIVEILPEKSPIRSKNHLAIAHDYIEIYGKELYCAGGDLCKKLIDVQSTNTISYNSSVQIPIFGFANTMLPLLNQHKYCTPEHVKSYNYSNRAVTYYKDKVCMVDIYLKGAISPITVSQEDYPNFIKSIKQFVEYNDR